MLIELALASWLAGNAPTSVTITPYMTIFPTGVCPKHATGMPISYCAFGTEFWFEGGTMCHSDRGHRVVPICGCWNTKHQFVTPPTDSSLTCTMPGG